MDGSAQRNGIFERVREIRRKRHVRKTHFCAAPNALEEKSSRFGGGRRVGDGLEIGGGTWKHVPKELRVTPSRPRGLSLSGAGHSLQHFAPAPTASRGLFNGAERHPPWQRFDGEISGGAARRSPWSGGNGTKVGRTAKVHPTLVARVELSAPPELGQSTFLLILEQKPIRPFWTLAPVNDSQKRI